MANLKNITELPAAESADGLNLIVNDNGVAKQIAASEVGAQADWSVMDENSPAFVKNKPVIAQADWAETDETSTSFVKNKPDNVLTYDKNNPPAGVNASGVFTGGPDLVIRYDGTEDELWKGGENTGTQIDEAKFDIDSAESYACFEKLRAGAYVTAVLKFTNSSYMIVPAASVSYNGYFKCLQVTFVNPGVSASCFDESNLNWYHRVLTFTIGCTNPGPGKAFVDVI